MSTQKSLGHQRLNDHLSFLFDMLPEINSVYGYLFYSFCAYVLVMFLGWLANPTTEKIREDYVSSTRNLQQGRKMREINKQESKKH